MLITGNNSEIMEIINKIKNKYKISNCQKAKYILGITIERINQCYYISQQNIIENLLKHFHITNIKKALHAQETTNYLTTMNHSIPQHTKAPLVH